MSFHSRCISYSVIVGDGSGVLFQPMTEEYTYILTARHNVEIENEIIKDFSSIDIQVIDEDSITIQEIYPHNNVELDIAIIKIDKINKETPFKYSENLVNREQQYHFYGFPQYKRDENPSGGLKEKIENFNLTYNKSDSHIVTFNNLLFAEQPEINSCSGGGIFKEDEGSIYLIAVEFGMNAARHSGATHQRIDAVSIKAFDEIVEQNSDELVRLCPPFMNDFNLLVSNIFLLNDFEDKRDLVRNKLIYLAQKIASYIKPLDIKKEFEKELFVNGHDINNISNSELWSMYLEFILLSILLDDKDEVTIESIKEIYKKRKFLYAKTNKWIELKEDIIKSNLHYLQKDGIVIIACDGEHSRRPSKCELSHKTIVNITNPPQREEMRIDRGIDYTKDLRYKHIYSVEEHLLTNEDKFDSATNMNIEERIKEVLKNVFD